MRHIIRVRETKEVYHHIEVEVEDDMLLDKIQDGIDMGYFEDIDSIVDYVDEIVPVCSVDGCCEEMSKEFWCEEIYEEDF